MENSTTTNDLDYCSYFQANVKRDEAWFVVAALKMYDHLVLDRTLDVQESLFEFFVTPLMEEQFLQIMNTFEAQALISNLRRLPNRLKDPLQKL